MVTKVQRWGNSQGLRLSKALLAEAGVEIGDEVEVVVRDGELVLSPVRRVRGRHDLAKLVAKLQEYPGFASVSSDYFNNTPSLDIEIRRDQARTYGVSEARILSLLRTAYSQNYVYLIKKSDDQYQVILEVEDEARSKPEDLSLLYIKSDDGENLVPLSVLVDWKQTLGPQSVNHLNQFTSVTISFNLKPGVPIGASLSQCMPMWRDL